MIYLLALQLWTATIPQDWSSGMGDTAAIQWAGERLDSILEELLRSESKDQKQLVNVTVQVLSLRTPQFLLTVRVLVDGRLSGREHALLSAGRAQDPLVDWPKTVRRVIAGR